MLLLKLPLQSRARQARNRLRQPKRPYYQLKHPHHQMKRLHHQPKHLHHQPKHRHHRLKHNLPNLSRLKFPSENPVKCLRQSKHLNLLPLLKLPPELPNTTRSIVV